MNHGEPDSEPALASQGIRDARLDELDDLMALVRACIEGMRREGIDQWDEKYPDRATIEGDLRAGTTLVALHDGAITGMVVLNEDQAPEYAALDWTTRGRVAVVHRLMVAPTREGRGLGRALMRCAERRAVTMGYDCVRLDAFCDNARALRFYERDGYRRVGRVRFRKGAFDCFEKSLPRPSRTGG